MARNANGGRVRPINGAKGLAGGHNERLELTNAGPVWLSDFPSLTFSIGSIVFSVGPRSQFNLGVRS
jgi:hypothetical protein